MRQLACDFVALGVSEGVSEWVQVMKLFSRTGKVWADHQNYSMADNCFDMAMKVCD